MNYEEEKQTISLFIRLTLMGLLFMALLTGSTNTILFVGFLMLSNEIRIHK
jgi:hypothetical protein